MVLIDEKGNILGKLNVVDFIILLILISIFVATVYLFNSYGEYKDESIVSIQKILPSEPIMLKLILETPPIPEANIKYLKMGDREVSLENIEGVVKDIKIKDFLTYDKNNCKVEENNGTLKVLELQMLVKPRQSSWYYFYSNNQPIKIGKYLDLNFPFLDIKSAIIKDIEISKTN